MVDEQRPKRPPIYLREHRLAAGIDTQPALADRVLARSPDKPVSVPTISLIEKKGAAYGYSIEMVMALAKALDLEPWELFIPPDSDALWEAIIRLVGRLPNDTARGALSGMIAGARTHLDKAG